jgi:hypothetical protein
MKSLMVEAYVYTPILRKVVREKGYGIPRLKCIMDLIGSLGQIISLIAKILFFNSVHVWLYLAVSKLDFNVLVIPTMYFGLDMSYVLSL